MARGPNAVPVHHGLSNPPAVFVGGENPVLDCYWDPNTLSALNSYFGTGTQGGAQICAIFIAA